MRKVRALVLMVVVGLGMVGAARGTAAQDNALDPLTGGALLEMLGYVPDNERSRLYVSFSDFAAADQSNPDAARFESTEAYVDAIGSAQAERVLNNMPIFSLPGTNYLLEALPDVPVAMGVDLMQLEQAVHWGVPPEQGFIWQGGFEIDAVAAAHEARNYEHTTVSFPGGDFSIWCGEVGCDEGMRVNLENRLQANLFGGDLGRQFPFLVADLPDNDVIASSPSLAVVQDTIGLMLDEDGESLASVPAYRLAAEAIDGFAHASAGGYVLRQAMMVDVSIMLPVDEDGLPPFDMMTVAELGTEDSRVTLVMLSYGDAGDAETTAPVLDEQIATSESARQEGRTIVEMIEERGGTILPSQVIEGDGGAVVILPLTQSPPEAPGDSLFDLMFSLYAGLDLDWLRVREND